MAKVYLGVGSNLGDRASAIEAAVRELSALPGTGEVRLGPVYETEPVGGPADQGRFLNSAIELVTELSPAELHAALQRIERTAGRPAASQREQWGPRVLDLDVLLYDDQVVDTDELTVPHPRMHERWFVLKPLADLAPNAIHPVKRRTIAELLAALE